MKLTIQHSCAHHTSYRAARVRSLFNVEDGSCFNLEAELPVDEPGWHIGVIVGPSGSGKTSLGTAAWGPQALWQPAWPADAPIVDAIAPQGGFDEVTAALSAVGLGSVPPWLRPFRVLSQGEQFRANLARLVCEAPARAVVDEFTSVVDRQIARIGALAFGKAWRRTGGQVILLTPHHDVLEWLQPDWVYDTGADPAKGEHRLRRSLPPRPPLELGIHETCWDHWPAFEPHHYLKLPKMIAATCYVATIERQPVAHVAVSTRPGMREARACRLVVMPEWQGAGVGLRFLNTVCERWRQGRNRYGIRVPTLFHTSHPGLAAALRRSPAWTQVSAVLYGQDRARCMASMQASAERGRMRTIGAAGYGGHLRAVQGFRYLGAPT
jgi:GNAT superfamily N-acetyltransferase